MANEPVDSVDDSFRELSVRFFREVRAIYGKDIGEETVRLLESKLGKSWSGQVLYDVLADTYPQVPAYLIEKSGPEKIAAIKAVRMLTGLGLKEAKDVVIAADTWPQIVRASEVDATSPERARESARNFERSMAAAGYTVRPHYGQ